ncbi:MAG: hypothetical protein MUC95_09390, partial [Spirochaetes bacterium]|nr:hypothetical protein [Spirochaetota bacterium]
AEKNSSFLICLNAYHADMNFILHGMGQNWELVLYTLDAGKTTARIFGRGENFCMAVHSLAVFRTKLPG